MYITYLSSDSFLAQPNVERIIKKSLVIGTHIKLNRQCLLCNQKKNTNTKVLLTLSVIGINEQQQKWEKFGINSVNLPRMWKGLELNQSTSQK
jgi:hypothetical protein